LAKNNAAIVTSPKKTFIFLPFRKKREAKAKIGTKYPNKIKTALLI
jgi:hypothetical protein